MADEQQAHDEDEAMRQIEIEQEIKDRLENAKELISSLEATGFAVILATEGGGVIEYYGDEIQLQGLVKGLLKRIKDELRTTTSRAIILGSEDLN